jgi:hypothetical protein
MNAGITGATIGVVTVVALTGMMRRRVTGHFLAQHAISAEDAVPYAPKGLEKSQLRFLLKKQAVREAAPGRYWLDRAVLAAVERRQRAWAMPLVALLLAGIAAVLLLAYR